MEKLAQLSFLIDTMSKAEKRYFRLFGNLQKGKKEYLFLYDKLENCETTEDACKAFCRKYGKKNIEASARYLYNQLMDCLVYLNQDSQVQNSIFQLIMQASLLYERHLVDEAFRTLSKAKQLANNFEQDILLMLIRRMEIIYITETGVDELTEKELAGKHTKLNECLKYTRSTNMHISLYSTLKFRLHYLPEIRSGKQKDLMNDLVLSELNLVSNNYYQGFESMKLHLLFQASYYLNTGSYKSAVRYYAELLNLFDEYEYFRQNPPVYYFSTLEGIIDSLLTAGFYDEIPAFIEKLKTLRKQDYPKDFLLKVYWSIFFSRIQYLMHTGRFAEAGQLCLDYEDTLYKKVKSLHPANQLKLYVSSAVICLYNSELKRANGYMEKIFRESKTFRIFPVYKTARLLKLIINAELTDYDLLDNEIRSIKHSLRKEVQAYLTEKVVFKFVLMYPIPKYQKTREQLWKKLEKDILKIRNNKYERHLLNIFDFTHWIELKLTGK
jgi:hypothetical protein